jgi:hypothetical protein
MLSRPLRAYLILVLGNGEIETSVHRDLETLLDSWNKIQAETGVVGLIHVGFSRLDTEKLRDLNLTPYSGKMLLTESAKWALLILSTTSRNPIAFIDTVPVYLSLTGWGYSIDDQSADLGITPNKTNSPISFSDWLTDIDVSHLDLANVLGESGIYDEKSYLNQESKVSAKYRHEIGVYRFSKLTKYDETDPITIFESLPPWVLSVELGRLNLRVRTLNALHFQGVFKVADLKGLSGTDLLKIPNFGQTSKYDLTEKLKNALVHGLGIEAYVPERPSSLSDRMQPEVQVKVSTVEQAPEAGLSTLTEQINYALSRLSQVDHEVLVSRMGFGTEPESLEKIGQKFHITRERIRQIESRALKNISASQTWIPALEQKLLSLLKDREFPLLFSGLEEYDPWFTGVQNIECSFKYILDNKKLLNSRFSLIEVNGRLSLSELDNAEWVDVQKRAVESVKRLVGKKVVISDVRKSVEGLLQVRGRELRSELWHHIKSQTNFSKTNDEEFSYLAGYGKTIDSVVAAILAASDKPLRFNEIAEIFVANERRNVTYRQIHVAAGNVGLLFGRGSYGLLKHLQLTQYQVDQISDLIVKLISEDQSNRQWSSSELLSFITGKLGTFSDVLNIFTLNICLNDKQELKYLGRNVWVYSQGENDDSNSRIDITQAVTTLIMRSGRPLTKKEIKAELAKDRGVSANFQIHAIDSLINLGDGLWGLMERDVPFNFEEQAKLLSVIKQLLEIAQHGLPVGTIVDKFRDYPDLIAKTDNPDIYAGVAVKSGIIKRSKEDCLYLAAWGNDRLIKRSDAISSVLKNNPNGLSVDELVHQAKEILGRDLKSDGIYSTLRALGAFFNHEAQVWQLGN